MSEALTAATAGPQTDTLAEQADAPNPQTNLIPEQTPEDAPKSPEAKRSNSVKDAIDKALGPEDDEKPAEKPKAEVKPDAKAEKAKAEPLNAAKEAETAPADAAKAEEQPKPAPKPTAYREAPSGFDDAAKGEWEAVPESVRGAVHRRHQELERGIQKYRQDAEQFEPVRQYAEMAKKGGTDLPTALHKYVGMETELRRDPISGLQQVVANLGLKKPDGSAVTLRDVAASIMGQPADQAASRQEATISHLTQTIGQLQQQIGGFSQHVERQQQEAKVATAENEWSTFQRANPRAAELEPQIADALQRQNAQAYGSLTERLNEAYAVASAQNPSVAHTDVPPLAQTQPTPKQANPAGQKSISGAPGGNDAKSQTRKLSRKESIEKAMRSAGI